MKMTEKNEGRRWEIYDPYGREGESVFEDYEFLCRVGDLDLLHLSQEFWSYVIVCDPVLRKKNRWNASPIDINPDRTLDMDDDGHVDLYHQCLIYQAIASHLAWDKKEEEN
jgi:hypothetical protein